ERRHFADYRPDPRMRDAQRSSFVVRFWGTLDKWLPESTRRTPRVFHAVAVRHLRRLVVDQFGHTAQGLLGRFVVALDVAVAYEFRRHALGKPSRFVATVRVSEPSF